MPPRCTQATCLIWWKILGTRRASSLCWTSRTTFFRDVSLPTAVLWCTPPSKTSSREATDMSGAEYLLFILMLSIFLGFELINKVPATLHTPLMSGANAISGITVVGAVALAGTGNENMAMWLGVGAVTLASINVVG